MPGDGEKACFISSRIGPGMPASQQRNPDLSENGESPFGPLAVASSALTGGRTLISCWNGWKGCPDLIACAAVVCNCNTLAANEKQLYKRNDDLPAGWK